MIVVDTNIIAYLFLRGEKTALAQQVARLDPSWIVPRLWRHEFLNVLATYCRAGKASLDEITDIWSHTSSVLSKAEREVDMRLALELAVSHNVSAYDAQYIVLARSVGIRCVTEDRRLLRNFSEIAISMEEFCAISP